MQSVFTSTNHLFLRAPDGGVEDVASMKAAGFGSIFCNIGDYAPHRWDVVRQQARNAGVVCGPWLRTADGQHGFSLDKFHALIATADEWQTPFIVNSESELKGSGKKITQWMADHIGNRDAAISMEAWPFADVEWWPLAKYPFLPQIFPQESEAGGNPEACREQWYAYGVECVVYTFGTYGFVTPLQFDRLFPYGLYTADDCGGDFSRWSPMGTRKPCQMEIPIPPGGNVPDIGSQHGITAFMAWLRKQPGVPTNRPPNYNPNNPGTWPWPERFERTLNMLREDHDRRHSVKIENQ